MSAREFRRKDLKEDEFVSTTTRVTGWLMQRRRKIGWALLGVVVVGSVIAGVRLYQERREERAAGLLATAMEIYRSPVVDENGPESVPATGVETEEGVVEAGDVPATGPDAAGTGTQPPPPGDPGASDPPDESAPTEPSAGSAADPTAGTSPRSAGTPPPGPESTTAMADEHAATGHRHFASQAAKYRAAREALTPVAEDYDGTAAGKVASFYLGICEAELGNIDAAVNRFEAAAESSQQLVAAMALYRLGTLHLDQGDAEEAAARFARLVGMSGEFFPREQALMARARAQEAAGDLRAALAAYQRVVNEYGESVSAPDARERVEELSSRLGLNPDVEG